MTDTAAIGCCKEQGCRRKQPFKIRRGPLSGRIYLLAQYRDLGSVIETHRRHDMTEEVEAFIASETGQLREENRLMREGLIDLAERCDGQYPSDIARSLVDHIFDQVEALSGGQGGGDRSDAEGDG